LIMVLQGNRYAEAFKHNFISDLALCSGYRLFISKDQGNA